MAGVKFKEVRMKINRSIITLSILLITIVIAGCATGGRSDSQRNDMLKQRASFDFDCPASQLSFSQPMAYSSSIQPYPTSYGVSGCGKKGVYVYIRNAWILNSK